MLRSISFLLILLAGPLAAPAGAQSIWMPRDRDRAILLEALHPSMEYSDTDVPTGALFLGGRMRLGGSVDLFVELPYAMFEGVYASSPFFSQDWSGTMVGNPYLGVEIHPGGSDFFVELGARAPLGDDDEYIVRITGQNADRTRFDAFSRHYLPVHAVFNLRHVTPSGLSMRLRFGPILSIDTEHVGAEYDDVHAVFAWMIGYEGTAARIGTAISGTSLLSLDSGNLGSRTRTQVEAHADFGDWTIRPGVDVKLPIGAAAVTVPIVLGFSLAASF